MTTISSQTQLETLVKKVGFLPFFTCGVPGYSLEDMVAPDKWWGYADDDNDGGIAWAAWEWKGPIIQNGEIAYGKFFRRKAVFVSLEWLPDLINYRRSLQPKISEDQAALDDVVLQTIEQRGSATIKELRSQLGFARGRRKRSISTLNSTLVTPDDEKIPLDPILTRLQMETRLVIQDFEYNIDRHGRRYGWGVARYATPERLYGVEIGKVDRSPEESLRRILSQLESQFKSIPAAQFLRLLKL